MSAQTDIEEEARHWFVTLRDDDAPESAWFDFQVWLEASSAHVAAYDAIESLWVDLDAAAPRPVIAPVVNLAEARVRRTKGRTSWLAAGLGVAASVALAVGLSFWLVPDGQTYATTDAPLTVALEDGSHVYLNRQSSLNVRFERGRRSVALTQGEAAFDIVHEPSRPFVVAAGDHQVEVLGTAFNVLNYGDDFAVAVARGVVAVSPVNAPKVRLTAGQALEQHGMQTPALSRVAPDQASPWRQGVLVYRNRPLADVTDDLSRYLDKPVVLSRSAQALRFTGALRIGDEAVMLKQLQDFVPVRVDVSAREVRVTAREAG